MRFVIGTKDRYWNRSLDGTQEDDVKVNIKGHHCISSLSLIYLPTIYLPFELLRNLYLKAFKISSFEKFLNWYVSWKALKWYSKSFKNAFRKFLKMVISNNFEKFGKGNFDDMKMGFE